MQSALTTNDFSRFKSAIMGGIGGDYPSQELLIEQDGRIAVYYAPFEHINPNARVAIVGLTPGPTQMANAIAKARTELQRGSTESDILRKAKRFGAFSGEVFRHNLARQLDNWGLHRYLGIGSTCSLFGEDAELLHATSLLRYPVFVDGKKYEGDPNILHASAASVPA